MMHHNNHGNVHGVGGGAGPHAGPPPGQGPMHRHQMHQPMPHQPMPPHQMHHDTRHPMGLSQPNSMGSVGQSMGGMGQPMGVPPSIHGPARPPHPIRPMTHHAPAQHHSMPPMKTMRRPYHMGGSYGAQPPLQPPPSYPQPPPPQPAHLHLAPPPPPEVSAEGTMPTSSEAPSEASAAAGAAGDGEGAAAQAGDAATEPPNPLANSKEKTPMCLVNELARFNKIKHQYRLTSETGPAHKKTFTVTLRLGETEEYTAEGSSIKRAQHAAASVALTQTRHTFPPPKMLHHTPTHAATRHTGAVMPTVELNALAMKLCQPAIYTSVPPVPTAVPPPGVRYPRFRPPYPPYAPRFHSPHPGSYPPPHYAQRGGLCGLRGVAPVYRVRVSVGDRSWPGEGPTPQAARHDAAARALQDLRDQLAPDSQSVGTPTAHSPVPTIGNGGDVLSLDVKSPVSLVHELALKRSLSVIFTVKSESGPPHMRTFVTTCTVGELESEGEGNGKKMSKKKAAENMLEEMKNHWPLVVLRSSMQSRVQQQQRLKRKQLPPKKKPRNLIKENGEVSTETVSESSDNPISRLAMVRHAERARSPQYLVVEERGAPRKREFIVQCDAPPHHATGVGPNKKTAKRRAAHNVLAAMGLTSGGGEPIVKNNNVDAEKPADSKLRTEVDAGVSGVSGGGGGALGGEVRQPVPGVLLMPDYSHRASAQPVHTTNGISETAATGGAAASSPPGGSGDSPGAKDQLLYLSQLLGFNVQFSDFPKRNHGEYLSLVALSTVPPVMCHGGGASTQQSHEQCSRAALRALAHMGLDTPSHDTAQAISSGSAKSGILSNGHND